MISRQDGLPNLLVLFFDVKPIHSLPLASPTRTSPESSSTSRSSIWFCPEKYAREESITVQFAELLQGLRLDDDVKGFLTKALRQSHSDEKRFHGECPGAAHR